MVGRVKEIWRYPVKSMAGESMKTTPVGPMGIAGDRAWAMHDDAEILSARHVPPVLMCGARYLREPSAGAVSPAEITFPDGTRMMSDDPAVHEKVSAVVKRPVRLMPLQPPEDLAYYRRRPREGEVFMSYLLEQFGREPGEPLPDMAQFPQELMEFAAFPGMHFDVTPLQFLTTATLKYLAGRNPGARWDVRRFRPNFVIETTNGQDGPVEAGWAGRKLRVGSLTLDCAGPTPRCAMTMQAQKDFAFDKTILRTIVKDADQNLGAYATTRDSGTLSVGDPVELL
jgi:hypothetical protein